MRLESQENSNEPEDDGKPEMFEVRDGNRFMCVLRRAGLSSHFVLSMRGRRRPRFPNETQVDRRAPELGEQPAQLGLSWRALRSLFGAIHAARQSDRFRASGKWITAVDEDRR